MNFGDGNVKQISDEPSAGYKMKWSPDSKAILSRVAKYEGVRRYNAVKVFNVETGESELLTDYRTMMPGLPQWSDGGAKVFLYCNGETEVLNYGTNEERNNQLTSEKVVYLKDDKIAVEDFQTNQVKTFEPVEGERVLNVQLSPDGNKIAFEIIGGNMYVINIDGTGLTNLGTGYRPSWSPGSNYIVYMITEDDGHNILSSDLYLININGTEKTNLTNTNDIIEMNPDWSSDGNRIAYDVPEEGAIYVMDLEEIN
jgi:Tol biopolymer transport system component